jgi:hypothetical protein
MKRRLALALTAVVAGVSAFAAGAPRAAMAASCPSSGFYTYYLANSTPYGSGRLIADLDVFVGCSGSLQGLISTTLLVFPNNGDFMDTTHSNLSIHTVICGGSAYTPPSTAYFYSVSGINYGETDTPWYAYGFGCNPGPWNSDPGNWVRYPNNGKQIAVPYIYIELSPEASIPPQPTVTASGF